MAKSKFTPGPFGVAAFLAAIAGSSFAAGYFVGYREG